MQKREPGSSTLMDVSGRAKPMMDTWQAPKECICSMPTPLDWPWHAASGTRSLLKLEWLPNQVDMLQHLEIIEFSKNPSHKFIVLASDGVWDLISNDEVMEFVKPYFKDKQVELATERIVREAFNRWKSHSTTRDDISSILIFLWFLILLIPLPLFPLVLVSHHPLNTSSSSWSYWIHLNIQSIGVK